MRDLVYPITKRLFFQNLDEKVTIYGIQFELKDMVSNLLFLVIFIILLYLSVKYLLGGVFRRLIKRNKESANNKRLTELYKIKLMKENNEQNSFLSFCLTTFGSLCSRSLRSAHVVRGRCSTFIRGRVYNQCRQPGLDKVQQLPQFQK